MIYQSLTIRFNTNSIKINSYLNYFSDESSQDESGKDWEDEDLLDKNQAVDPSNVLIQDDNLKLSLSTVLFQKTLNLTLQVKSINSCRNRTLIFQLPLTLRLLVVALKPPARVNETKNGIPNGMKRHVTWLIHHAPLVKSAHRANTRRHLF